MTLEGFDLPTIGGGLGILVVMVAVIRIAFRRLDKQDNTWQQLLDATVARAIAAETQLAEARAFILDAAKRMEVVRQENEDKIRDLSEQLEEAKKQIKELQKRNGET